MDNYGFLSLLPCALTVIVAVITKRTLEPLVAGALLGFIIYAKTGFFSEFISGLYGVMMDPTTVWLYCVCLPFGSLIALMEKSKGTIGFAEIAAGKANTRSKSLVATWLLGIFLFADDYFNALAVGTSMRRLTDKYHVSREFLAYIVNMTGATVCLVIPFSTWSAFMISQMEGSGAAVVGEGTAMYFKVIPFMFYCLFAIALVPLFIFKVIPLFGPLKKSEERAFTTGQTIPDSMLETIRNRDAIEYSNEDAITPKARNFLVPMLVLAGVTLSTSDMQSGVLISLATCIVMYLLQRLIPPKKMFDAIIHGMNDMVLPVAIVTMAFTLQAANTKLGMADYIIETVAPVMSPVLLPALTFIVVGVLGFCTGCFWGAAAIVFPIIVPLAQAVGVDMVLVCGAIMSGSAFGSTSCFFSDAPTLTCTSCQISNADYAKNILPLLIIPTLLAITGYLIAGFIFV